MATLASSTATQAAHTVPKTSPSSAAARDVKASLGEVKSKLMTTSPSAAMKLGEQVFVGKLVSAELDYAYSQHERVGLNVGCNHAGLSKTARGREQGKCPPSATCASSSSSSCCGGDSSYEAADLHSTELIFSFGRYVGQVDPLTRLRDGHGCLHYNNGSVYIGEWHDGTPHGFGEKHYSNGDVYRGNWRNGKRFGRGAHLSAQGHFYDGMYVEDQPEGYGIYTTLRGDRYTGWWKAGQRHGKGREALVDGQLFVGNWRHDNRQGRGRLYVPDTKEFIYGVWHKNNLFRELTKREMDVNSGEDMLDKLSPPCAPPAAAIPASRTRSLPVGAGMADHLLRGVTAPEVVLESLGKEMESATNDPAEVKSGRVQPAA
ncbi:hypothetical protein JKF63_05931 [Porcisia hertigi]|uniref:Uncharacterized protein n=1 Tax=Porcisia hertigi TaxID=2761500 RepID=A0A836IX63_9TRYP|nr:hypothetical protein JKF63_05931 [Porcisia hertigi]